MEIDIVDFLPKYPNIIEYVDENLNPYDDFYNSIYKKKEFYDERLPEVETFPDRAGMLMKHQNIIARYLSSHTVYDQLLLVHEMGTGKTCSSIGAIEQIRQEHSRFTGAMIFASGTNLLNNYTNELVFKCTDGRYIPEYRTELEKIHRINKIIKEYYSLNTFETFAKLIKKLSDEEIIKRFSNKIIVIDEVHNIRIQDREKDDAIKMYSQFWRFLHLVRNCKIMLMSGTPMKDTPDEIASVMNLILPEDEQLPVKAEFLDEFFRNRTDKNSVFQFINKRKERELKEKFKGRVSYLKAMQSSVVKEFMGRNIVKSGIHHFKVWEDQMGEFQTLAYIDSWNKDSGEDREEGQKGGGIYLESRRTILFAYPDGKGFSDYITKTESKKGIKKHLKSSSKYSMSSELKNLIKGENNEETLANIERYSSKYATTIRMLLDANREGRSAFVYCEYVVGSGSILFSLLLELFGFSKATGREESEAPRYAILTTETTNSTQVRTIVDRFNKPDNMNGQIISVIIGSRVISEGFSFKNIQEEHILTPHWNYSETAQIIARGWRLGSHNDLIQANIIPVVRIYQHVSMLNEDVLRREGIQEQKDEDLSIESIDLRMYRVSENKDISIKKVERLMKEAAFDCSLNYKRNFISGYDGQRECDYMECNYSCEGINPELLTQDLDDNELDYSTYQLYYANPEIRTIIEQIKILFMNTFQLDLNEIKKSFPNRTMFELITALRTIINESIIIKNRFGFLSYLKEENNKFFLVDSLSIIGGYTLEYYTKNPSISTGKDFNDIINDLSGEYTLEIIDRCCGSRSELELKQNIIELSLDKQEMFLESSILAQRNNVDTHTRDLILNYFRNYYGEFEGVFVSWLLTEHKNEQKRKIRCLMGNTWVDCSEEYLDRIKEQKRRNTLELENNPYRHYGMISDGVFKIRELPEEIVVEEEGEEETKTDQRGVSRGLNCTTWKKPKLLNLIVKRLKIPIPEGADLSKIDFIMNKSTEQIWNSINSQNSILKYIDKLFTIEEKTQFDSTDLQRIVFWNTLTVPNICKYLQDWFKEKGLVSEDIQYQD